MGSAGRLRDEFGEQYKFRRITLGGMEYTIILEMDLRDGDVVYRPKVPFLFGSEEDALNHLRNPFNGAGSGGAGKDGATALDIAERIKANIEYDPNTRRPYDNAVNRKLKFLINMIGMVYDIDV